MVGPTRFDRVIKRELCSVISKGQNRLSNMKFLSDLPSVCMTGTRTLSFLDGGVSDRESAFLLAVAEKVRNIHTPMKHKHTHMILVCSVIVIHSHSASLKSWRTCIRCMLRRYLYRKIPCEYSTLLTFAHKTCSVPRLACSVRSELLSFSLSLDSFQMIASVHD